MSGNQHNPTRLGGYDTGGRARIVQVVGNLCYVADENSGLQILDVSNPTAPALVREQYISAHTAHVIGDLAFVAPDLEILDVSNQRIQSEKAATI